MDTLLHIINAWSIRFNTRIFFHPIKGIKQRVTMTVVLCAALHILSNSWQAMNSSRSPAGIPKTMPAWEKLRIESGFDSVELCRSGAEFPHLVLGCSFSVQQYCVGLSPAAPDMNQVFQHHFGSALPCLISEVIWSGVLTEIPWLIQVEPPLAACLIPEIAIKYARLRRSVTIYGTKQ